jgi:hypothetical protein
MLPKQSHYLSALTLYSPVTSFSVNGNMHIYNMIMINMVISFIVVCFNKIHSRFFGFVITRTK